MAAKSIKSFKHKFTGVEHRAGVICVCKCELLLIKGYDTMRGQRYLSAKWGFPKGSQNIGETAAEAATRELYEETGINVKITSETPHIVVDREKCNEVLTLYVVELLEKPKVEVQESEISEYGWYTIQDIGALTCTNPTITAIQTAQQLSSMYVPVVLPDVSNLFNKNTECKCGQS